LIYSRLNVYLKEVQANSKIPITIRTLIITLMILQLRKRLKSIFLLKRLHSLIDLPHKKKEVARFQLRSLALITIQQLFPLLHQLFKTRTFSKCNRFRFRQLKAKSHQKVKLLLKTLDSTLSIIMTLAFHSLNRIILL